MDFESLRTSENKYKRYFYETIQECARRFELEEDTKNEIYETFMKKCEKQHPKIDGFSGPFKGKYLKRHSPQNKGKFYDTLEEAVEAVNRDHGAKGITLTRNGKYTIRMTTKLLDSPVNSKGVTEYTWVLENRKNIEEPNKGGEYEIISIKGVNYYFNKRRQRVYTMKKKLAARIIQGNIIFI